MKVKRMRTKAGNKTAKNTQFMIQNQREIFQFSSFQ